MKNNNINNQNIIQFCYIFIYVHFYWYYFLHSFPSAPTLTTTALVFCTVLHFLGPCTVGGGELRCGVVRAQV